MRITDMKSGIGQVYIREALQKADNCFLCYLENRFEERYLDNYLTYLVMDAGERERIIESRGFCNYHFYKMFALSTNPTGSDGHGMALILESVAEQVLDDVKSQRQAKSAGSRRPRLHLKRGSRSITASELSKTVAHLVKCPACDHVSTMIQIYTCDFLREVTEDEEILKLFDASRGMCIPHYVIALLVASRMSSEKLGSALERIIDKQIQVLERTQTDLAEYVEKQDYHFSQKDRAGTEKTVGESLVRVAGRRGIERTLTLILRSKESDMS
jgi:hypothetical protein